MQVLLGKCPVYAIDILNTQNLEWVQGAVPYPLRTLFPARRPPL